MNLRDVAALIRSLPVALEGVPKEITQQVLEQVAQKFDGLARDEKKEPSFTRLTFTALRAANIARLPVFKNKHGQFVHTRPDGSDWDPSKWLGAVVGELGEYANFRKKFERGDLSFEEYALLAAKELADVQIYLDILALRCLDRVEHITGSVLPHSDAYWCAHIAHPKGISLSEATQAKFNIVSDRVGCNIFL